MRNSGASSSQNRSTLIPPRSRNVDASVKPNTAGRPAWPAKSCWTPTCSARSSVSGHRFNTPWAAEVAMLMFATFWVVVMRMRAVLFLAALGAPALV